MDILLFTANSRKAEYFSLKMKAFNHTVFTVQTLAGIHHALRFSDPDFVIVDSETFSEPDNDYRTIIRLSRRRFLLYYDVELLALLKHDASGMSAQMNAPGHQLSEAQLSCISQITDVLQDIQLHRTLIDENFTAASPEGRQFLKQNELRLPHALILSCLLRNIGCDISASTLMEVLWADKESAHLQTLYAYMNQLRMVLQSRNIPLVIDKRMKGTYRICSINEADLQSMR